MKLIILLILACILSELSGKNIIKNAGAEKLDKNGIPLQWRKVQYNKTGKLFLLPGDDIKRGKNTMALSCHDTPLRPLGWGYQLYPANFKNIKPGTELTLSFDLTTFANPAVTVRSYIEFKNKNKFVGTFGTNHSVYAGWERKNYTFKMPSFKFTHASVYFMLKSEGKAAFDNVELKPGKTTAHAILFPDDFCRVVKMPPRRTWILPDTPRHLTLEYKIPDKNLEIELAEIDGKSIKKWLFPNRYIQKISQCDLRLPHLPEGAYELNFKSGKFTGTEWFAIRKKIPDGVHFTEDNFLIFKGKKIFPIAMAHPNRLGKNGLDGLRVYAQSGINMISEYEIRDTQHADFLNAVCNKFGFTLWLKEDFGHDHSLKGKALHKHIEQMKKYVSRIDNFIGFQSDEAAWQQWKIDSVIRHSKFRFKYAPEYYTWQCNAPRMTDTTGNPRSSFHNVRRYALAADITGADIYPVPEGRASHNNLPNQTLSCVGDYTELVKKAVWNNRPLWMVLQAMSWREERGEKPSPLWPRPDKKQLRFMVWNAITHGATGICWYGFGAWTDQYSSWYQQFAEVNLELAALAKIMLSGQKCIRPSVPKKVGVLHRNGILVFVNENAKHTVDININGKWFVSPNGKPFLANRYTLAPYEVLILTKQPLKLAPVKRFVPEKTILENNHGGEFRTIHINGNWTAHPNGLRPGKKITFAKHSFQLDKIPQKAILRISADDSVSIRVNGKRLSKNYAWHKIVHCINVSGLLKQGENKLEFNLINNGGLTGLVYELETDTKKIFSGKNTLFSLDGKSFIPALSLPGPPRGRWGAPTVVLYSEEK